MKNFARLSYRESSRRTTRERATAREEAVASAETLVEENELHGIVAETVAQLAEPYRSTVIEHFYHGRTSKEIASELGIPANTVRVRIRRAVLQLSNTLDRRCDGRRAMWLLPLLAGFLAPERLEALAIAADEAGSASSGSSASSGGSTPPDQSAASGESAGSGESWAPLQTIGPGPPNLAKALVPVATLALIAWLVIPNTFGLVPRDTSGERAAATALRSPSSENTTSENLASENSRHTSFGSRFDAVPVDSSSAISPPSATSSIAMIPRLVHVVDRSTGKPISDAEVFVESFSMVSDRLARGRSRLEYLMQPFARTPVGRTDARGILEADPARLARDRILVRAPGFSEFRERERLRISDDSGELRIDLVPAELASFEVRLPEGSPARRVPLRLVAASGAEIAGETDAAGRFEFLWEEGQYAVEIDLPGFREVRALALPDTTITLARASRSTYTVTNARGLPIAEAAVEIRLADRTLLRTETGLRGTFSFHAGTDAGTGKSANSNMSSSTATVHVSHPKYPAGQFEITIHPHARTTAPLTLSDPSWIEGTVFVPAVADASSVDEPAGSPSLDRAGGGIVLAIPTSPFYVRDLPQASIDRDGRFRLGPLAAGSEFSLRVEGVDRAGVALAPLEIAADDVRLSDPRPYETRKVEVTLEAGRVLEGRVITPGGDPLPGVRLRLGAVVGDELRGPLVETDRDGRFRFVGIAPEAEPFRPTLREPRWSALGTMDPPPATGRLLQVLTPHQLLAAGDDTIPRKFFLGSRNTLSVPDSALQSAASGGSAAPFELIVAPWPAERMPRVELRDADGSPVRDVLNWVIYPPDDPADVSAIFAGTDGNPVRIGDPTPLEGCWIQFLSENHAVAGGWFGLRGTAHEQSVWEVTLLPRVEYRLRFRTTLTAEGTGGRAGLEAGAKETVPLANTDLWWIPEEALGISNSGISNSGISNSGMSNSAIAISLGRTDANGELTVDQLPPGRYRLIEKRAESNEDHDAETNVSETKSTAAKSSRPPRPFKDAIAFEDGTPIGFLEIPQAGGAPLGERRIEVLVDPVNERSP